MIKKLTLLCLLLSLLQEARSKVYKILFIGNSYTAVNQLPQMLKDLSTSMGDTLEIDSNTPGGMTFNGHSTLASTLAKIQTGGWDFVVLQAQSQEPSFSPTQVATDTYPYAAILDSLIHAYSPCAETIFYMTWGRKNGDASNCAVYPPVCTYDGMQQRLRESYLEMCQQNQATCAPAGVAWKRVRNLFPGIELYQTDESHPSIHGTYLVACTFYATLFQKSCAGSTFVPAGIGTADGFYLQQTASQTVLDSLENWQGHGHLPKAAFQYTSSGLQVQFSNQSLRSSSYVWDFGDGSLASTNTNPQHTYSAPGNYIVTLYAKNSCGLERMATDTLQLTSFPNSLTDTGGRLCSIDIYPGVLCIRGQFQDGDFLDLTDYAGRIVLRKQIQHHETRIPVANLSGPFFYRILRKGILQQSGKIIIP